LLYIASSPQTSSYALRLLLKALVTLLQCVLLSNFIGALKEIHIYRCGKYRCCINVSLQQALQQYPSSTLIFHPLNC
jgi:hypothetical protein